MLLDKTINFIKFVYCVPQIVVVPLQREKIYINL